MSNSAHDDVSIIDSEALEQIYDADVRKIFTLIQDMQTSDALGHAQFLCQKIQLELQMPKDEDNLFVQLQTNMAVDQGWLAGPLGAFFQDEQSNCLSDKDIAAIEAGDFSMELTLWDAPEALTLTELLQNMDVFEVGRPSTAASIIETLMQKSELIEIEKEGDKVIMTPQGREVYEVLQKHLGDVASLRWNSEFGSQLAQVESGELPAAVPILDVFEALYGHEASKSLQQLSWTDPDDLYQEPEQSTQTGKIAISRSHTHNNNHSSKS